MRKFVLAISTLLFLVGLVPQSNAADEQVQISGSFSYAGSSIAGAKIQISGPGGSATGTTDGTGRFDFEVAPTSGYELTVEWKNPSLSMTNSVRFFFSGIDLSVAREVAVSLPSAKRITIRAVDQAGNGIAGANANLTGTNYGTWTKATASAGGSSYASSAVNQSMGSATGDGLGNIYLDIFEWRNEISVPVIVPSPAGGTIQGTATFNPSQVDSAEVVFNLPASNPLVSGKVQFANGQPLPNLTLTGGGGGYAYSTRTDAGGNFSFSVPQGQTFNIIASGAVSGYAMLDRIGFSVEGAAVNADSSVTVTIPDPNIITARVQDQDGIALEGVQLSGYGTNLGSFARPSITGLGGSPVISNLGQGLGRATTNDQGEALLAFWSFANPVNLNATYLSQLGSSANGTLTFTPDGPKAVSLTLEIPKVPLVPDESGSDGTGTEESNFSLISGRLLDSGGNAASGARITGGNGSTGYDVRTARDGRFSFAVTKTGVYNMIVDWYDPPFNFTKRVGFSLENLDFSVDRELVMTVPNPKALELTVVDNDGIPIRNALVRSETTTLGTFDYPIIVGANSSIVTRNIGQSLSTARTNERGIASLAFGSWRSSVEVQIEVVTCSGTKVSETHSLVNTTIGAQEIKLRSKIGSQDVCRESEVTDAEKPISNILPKVYVTSSGAYAFVIGENVSGRRISIQTGGKWYVFQPESDKFTYYFPFPEDSDSRLIKLWLDGTYIGEERATRLIESSNSASISNSASPKVSFTSTPGELVISVENSRDVRISTKVNGKWLVDVSSSTKWSRTWNFPEDIREAAFEVYLDRVRVLAETVSVAPESGPVDEVSGTSESSSSNLAATSSDNISIAWDTEDKFVDFIIGGASGSKVSIKFGGRWFQYEPETQESKFRVISTAGANVEFEVYVDKTLRISSKLVVGSNSNDSSQTISPETGSTLEDSNFSLNVDSADGVVKFTALNAENQKVSLKFGGRWIVFTPNSVRFEQTTTSLSGQEVSLEVYLEGAKVSSQMVLIR